ncbi:MAG TPA: succinylglutamate desuccinylase/aspartoacylase family protein [Ktedonobacteraceae bacterium]
MTNTSREGHHIPWNERTWNIGPATGLRANSKISSVIEHGSYADGTPLQSALHILVGAEDGPILYVQAAVHGDEVNGVEVLRRVFTRLDPSEMRGILIVVPVANVAGFVQHQRRNPLDEEDMNRVWPGKAGGQTSQHIAYDLYQQAINYAEYVIDLHTANSNTALHVVYGRGDEASRNMAEAFGLPILLEEEVTEDLKQLRFTGKLRNFLASQGIAAITPELGGNNCFEEEHIRLGAQGVINVMRYLAMLEGAMELPEQPPITLFGSHLDRVWATQGGIWVAHIKAGDRVSENQPLGEIYSIRTFEVVEYLKAPYDGYVLGTTDVPIVNMGEALVNICRF